MHFNQASLVILPINISTKIDKKPPKALPFLNIKITFIPKPASVIIYKIKTQRKEEKSKIVLLRKYKT